jgi:hypothetical protein
MVDSRFYQKADIIPLKEGEKSNVIFVPWQMICTHTIISDENGTRRIRQVSRWILFKLWFYKLFHIKRWV